MAPVGPWAQPKATRREGGRRAERPVGSCATPDTPCSRTAPKGLPQTEAWAERERVPSGHNCRRQLATGSPEKYKSRARQCPERRYLRITRSGAGRLWSRRAACFLWSFLSLRKKGLLPSGAAAPPPAPESARQPPLGTASSKVDVHRYKHEAFLRTAITRFTLPCLFAQTPSLPYHPPLPHQRACQSPMMQKTLP